MTSDKLDFLAEYGHTEHLDYLIKHNAAIGKVSMRSDLTKDQVNQLASHSDRYIRARIAMHPNLSREHMDQFLQDTDHVREGLAKNNNITDEHLAKLREDPWWSVRYHADLNHERRVNEKWKK
jgi:hypothetical protein